MILIILAIGLFGAATYLLLLVAVSDTLTVFLHRPLVPTSMVDAYATAGFVPLFWLALIVAAPLHLVMLLSACLAPARS